MIFYLSATGNTFWAARQLAETTGERLVNMAQAGDGEHAYNLCDGERIGFCFPVHGWRPPLVVRNFIAGLSIDAGAQSHFCYALCTAGDTVGETMDILRNDLARRGIELHSCFSLLMPETYVGLPFMDVDTVPDERAKIERAASQLADFKQYIENRKSGVEILVRGHWPRVNSRILGSCFAAKLITDKPFRVDSSRCDHCQRCVKACPVGNMAWDNGKRQPAWTHSGRCMTCFNCYHHCPRHAIEYGCRTKHKGQYFFGRNKP